MKKDNMTYAGQISWYLVEIKNTGVCDDQFVRELVKDVGVDDSNVKFITRVGEKNKGKDK